MRPVVGRFAFAGVRAVALACAAWVAASTFSFTAGAGPSVRFHHFHFRVLDPAASMNRAATTLNGTRVLLRGLGVGVRVGSDYALFDRLDVSDRAVDADGSIEKAYDSARGWLVSHGVEIEPSDGGGRAELAAMFRSEALDHIAFTTADTSTVVAALLAHNARLLRQTDESRLFRTGSIGVEIVRDLDAPDAFWCPMHPDIRSSVAGKCPLCGMTLVAIPPPRIGEYRMDVAVTAGPGGRGASKLRVTIRDPTTSRPVSGFAIIHERLLHLFIIDRNLDHFRHVHPQQVADGEFQLKQDLPPGEFVVIADFLPRSGRAQMLQRAIVTPGYRGSLFPAAPNLTPDASTEKVDQGVRVKLEATGLKAGKEATLKFTLTDAENNSPVLDLEPFLGAPGHMLVVNAELTESNHVHPEEPATRGPVITFQPMMPAAGLYKLWLQFQRRGIVATVPFVVTVAGP
jgi:hypothetical protein